MNVHCKLAVAVVALAVAGAACSGVQPATAPAPDEDVGRFVWQDLMTDDVDRAKDFYGALLGWQFEEATRLGDRYVLVLAGGAYVAGMTHVDHADDPDARIDQWLSYLSVADADQTVAEVSRAGGEVLVAPLDIGANRAAVVADRQGALLGLVQLPTVLSMEARQALDADAFIWRDYLADDVEGALSFYREVAGFDAQRTDRSDDIVHYVLGRGTPRGGMFDIGNEPVEPNWLPYVRVDDAAAAARRAQQLGGRVVVAPRQDLNGGTLAVIADPGGAGIALQEWPDSTGEDR